MKFDHVEKIRENIKIRVFRYYYCITLLYFFKLWKSARKHYLVIGERKVNNSVTKKKSNLRCISTGSKTRPENKGHKRRTKALVCYNIYTQKTSALESLKDTDLLLKV